MYNFFILTLCDLGTSTVKQDNYYLFTLASEMKPRRLH